MSDLRITDKRGPVGGMKRSFLVQRLKAARPKGPEETPLDKLAGALTGTRQGFNEEAWQILTDIFAFDYMGSSEFEYGAVPKAFAHLAKAERLCGREIEVDLSLVPYAQWKKKGPLGEPVYGEGVAGLYILSRASQVDEVQRRIEEWLGGGDNLKERLLLREALLPLEPRDTEIKGWLEIDNGYMFFVDREMFELTCAIFGVKVP